MVTKIGKGRRKTRSIFKRPSGTRGRIPISKFMQKFSPGDKVKLVADTIHQKGIYFSRFHGKVGVVDCMRGRCFEVVVKDGKKAKTFILNAVHLKRV